MTANNLKYLENKCFYYQLRISLPRPEVEQIIKKKIIQFSNIKMKNQTCVHQRTLKKNKKDPKLV